MKAKKLHRITIAVSERTRKLLNKAAQEDKRTLSSFVIYAAREYAKLITDSRYQPAPRVKS